MPAGLTAKLIAVAVAVAALLVAGTASAQQAGPVEVPPVPRLPATPTVPPMPGDPDAATDAQSPPDASANAPAPVLAPAPAPQAGPALPAPRPSVPPALAPAPEAAPDAPQRSDDAAPPDAAAAQLPRPSVPSAGPPPPVLTLTPRAPDDAPIAAERPADSAGAGLFEASTNRAAAPPDLGILPTDAGAIIEEVIRPAAERFTAASVALQNAVLRHCLNPGDEHIEAVEEAFLATLEAFAGTEPHAFGAEVNSSAPERMLTEIGSTAFSRSRLEAMMNARITTPASLPELQGEDAALTGLPALEQLLLSPPYGADETKANRCRLAVPVAANIRDTASAVEKRWVERQLEPQWTSEEADLADRSRLRDLVQGMIDVSDRLERDLAQFARDPRGNERLPFARLLFMQAYLDAVTASLARQTETLQRFAEPGSVEAEAIARVASAAAEARAALAAGTEGREGALQWAARAQDEIAELPNAFGFAPEAFQRPLASFQPPAGGESPAAAAPQP